MECLQEDRDHNFGRVFGAEAVIKSNVLFANPAQIADWEHLLRLIFEAVKKKAWLSEECGWILYDALQTLKSRASGSAYAQKLIDLLVENDFAKTPEGVALWIAAKRNFTEVNLPKHVWHRRDPLNRKERKTLASILKETGADTSDNEASKVPQKGNWFPKLHVAWQVVFEAVGDPDSGRIKFSELWQEAVDGESPTRRALDIFADYTRGPLRGRIN